MEDGQVLTLTGTVEAREKKKDSKGNLSCRVTLAGLEAEDKGDIQLPRDMKALCVCDPEEGELCLLGARVRVRGRVQILPPASNPGAFDSRLYDRTQGIAFRVKEVRVLAVSASGDRLGEGLAGLRTILAGILEEACPDPDACGVLRAMLLGEKTALEAETRALYQAAGIVAILTISGLHISLLGSGLFSFLRKRSLPPLPAALLSVLAMVLYGRMTGMTASAVRALVMFGLRVGADLRGRTYDMLTAVSLAGILLLVRQPLYLMQSGFLFSFSAVLALALLSPALVDPDMKKPLQTLVQALSVSLAALPVYLRFYYTFPLYSILLNLAVTPLMGLVLVSGLMALLLGLPAALLPAGSAFFLISRDLSWLAAWPARGILAFYAALCRAAVRLPGSTLILGAPSGLQTALYLALLVLVVLAAPRMPSLIRLLALSAAVSLLTLRIHTGLELDLVDVGQGDGIYLEYDGLKILVDGGSSSEEDVWTYTLMPFLKYKGAGRLDYLILTHDDDDHMNGMLSLLEGLPENGFLVSCLLLPDVGEEMKGSDNYRALVRAADKASVPVAYIGSGDRIERDGLALYCLHPEKGAVYGEANWYSTTLYVTFGNFSALLTGDLEEEGEMDFLRSAAGRKDLFDPAGGNGLTLLKAGHHGSRFATSPDLLAFFRPEAAVFSCGRKNRYGHPAGETVERLKEAGARIFDTRTDGAVSFLTDGKKVHVRTFLQRRD